MGRLFILLFGLISYAIAMASLVYAVGFIGNIYVPKSIDTGQASPLADALIINVLLLGLFAVQHSVMARPAFKSFWTRLIPPAAERSMYVLLSGLILWLMFWQWRPITAEIWRVENETAALAIWALYFVGWAIVVSSTFLISHTDLFGLKQVFQNWAGKPQEQPEFKKPFLYKFVRHPIYFGMLLVFWAAPVMTLGHLVFSVATSGYILIGAWLEERDLTTVFGDKYREYRRQVAMLIPLPRRKP